MVGERPERENDDADGDERGGQAVHEGGLDAVGEGRAAGAGLIGDVEACAGGAACGVGGVGGESGEVFGQVAAVVAAVGEGAGEPEGWRLSGAVDWAGSCLACCGHARRRVVDRLGVLGGHTDTRRILVEVGRRMMVGGPEDMITGIALDLAAAGRSRQLTGRAVRTLLRRNAVHEALRYRPSAL